MTVFSASSTCSASPAAIGSIRSEPLLGRRWQLHRPALACLATSSPVESFTFGTRASVRQGFLVHFDST
jgi:hypothetical protein